MFKNITYLKNGAATVTTECQQELKYNLQNGVITSNDLLSVFSFTVPFKGKYFKNVLFRDKVTTGLYRTLTVHN